MNPSQKQHILKVAVQHLQHDSKQTILRGSNRSDREEPIKRCTCAKSLSSTRNTISNQERNMIPN